MAPKPQGSREEPFIQGGGHAPAPATLGDQPARQNPRTNSRFRFPPPRSTWRPDASRAASISATAARPRLTSASASPAASLNPRASLAVESPAVLLLRCPRPTQSASRRKTNSRTPGPLERLRVTPSSREPLDFARSGPDRPRHAQTRPGHAPPNPPRLRPHPALPGSAPTLPSQAPPPLRFGPVSSSIPPATPHPHHFRTLPNYRPPTHTPHLQSPFHLRKWLFATPVPVLYLRPAPLPRPSVPTW